jgi:hypothetical protein
MKGGKRYRKKSAGRKGGKRRKTAKRRGGEGVYDYLNSQNQLRMQQNQARIQQNLRNYNTDPKGNVPYSIQMRYNSGLSVPANPNYFQKSV